MPTSKIWEGNRRTMRVMKTTQVAKENAFSAGRKPLEVWLAFDSDEIVHAWDSEDNGPVCGIPAEVLEETLYVLAAHIGRHKENGNK
ncbi:hypothetical protein CYMTET_31381 [Cymbomonas tetramitiformis]|uniref:Uncharacterized protein n=1 Tax=Cymbomonas tetramitiformis TaxID=36881 RepID=A0AAE0FHA8_9CHLO|nr:hypothetical protein CYMTET_31381 [Cymbomonas tetramitiformis]